LATDNSSEIVHSFLTKLQRIFNNTLTAQQSLVHQHPSSFALQHHKMGEVKHAFFQVYSETEKLAAGTFQY